MNCSWQEVCFCGESICGRQGETVHYRERPSQAALAPSRRLAAVPSDKQASVDVAFGIAVISKGRLVGEQSGSWDFLEGFDQAQPWTQRNVLDFCEGFTPALLATQTLCWISSFRVFLNGKGERFPVHRERFNELAMRFALEGFTGSNSAGDFFWMRDNEVKASFVRVSVDIHKYAAVNEVFDLLASWDNYTRSWNARASRFARGAWHTSSLWVRAQAQEALISSTALTLSIAVSTAFLSMLIFTGDLRLSFYVVVATIFVISELAFFIVVIMGWPIGPMEVIALIVFIGYAVTYSLHIAHKYGTRSFSTSGMRTADIRYERTRYALCVIGNAALGSAVTTAGCSVFLLFCTLTIFKKLGSVVLLVTLLSIVTALGPLPAALLVIGPLQPGSCRRSAKLSASPPVSTTDQSPSADASGGGHRSAVPPGSLPPPDGPS